MDRDGMLEAGETDRVPSHNVRPTSGRDGESRLIGPLGEETFESSLDRACQERLLAGRSATGNPAFFHAVKPPAISTTGSSPIC